MNEATTTIREVRRTHRSRGILMQNVNDHEVEIQTIEVRNATAENLSQCIGSGILAKVSESELRGTEGFDSSMRGTRVPALVTLRLAITQKANIRTVEEDMTTMFSLWKQLLAAHERASRGTPFQRLL